MTKINLSLLLVLSIINFQNASALWVTEAVASQPEDKPKSKAVKPKPKKASEIKEARPAGDLTSSDVDVLTANKEYLKRNNDLAYALKWAKRIIAVSSDSEIIKANRLDIADMQYNLKEFEKAAEAYKEYLKLYPGSKDVEYAKYRHIASNYYRINTPNRDQTLTVELILQAKEYLETEPGAYKKEVEAILESALNNLFEAEVDIFESNLKALNFEGAKLRLDYAKKKYLPELPKIKNKIEDLEDSLEQSKKRGKYVRISQREKESLPKKQSTRKNFKSQF